MKHFLTCLILTITSVYGVAETWKDHEAPKENKLQVEITLHNDDDFSLIKKDGSIGDDYGETLGLDLKISKRFVNELLLIGSIKTKLFTAKVLDESGKTQFDGNDIVQNFTNQTVLDLVVHNKLEGKTIYYKGRLGYIHLDSQNPDEFYSLSKVQNLFHSSKGKTGRKNIPDGEGVRGGAIAGAGAGVQKSRKLGERFSLKGELEGLYNYSNLDKYSHTKVGADVALYYEINDGRSFKVSTRYGEIYHDDGTEKVREVSIGFQGKKIGGEFVTSDSSGELHNHSNYNLPSIKGKGNEPIFSFRVRYRW